MKRIYFLLLLACGVSIGSCYKPGMGIDALAKKIDGQLKGCQTQSFFGVTSDPETVALNGFTKKFDVLGRVVEVTAPEFGLVLSDSLYLLVKYGLDKVYFINKLVPADTVSTAQFNNKGQLQVIYGNPDYNFPTTEFKYVSNKLSSIDAFGVTLDFVFDGNGNVIKYVGNQGGGLNDYEFSYDLSVKVKDQIYIDFLAGWIYNNFTLAQIMGWTPDLTPKNKRTHARIFFDKTEIWYDEPITNHTFDATGRLTSYEVGVYTMYTQWRCGR